MAIWEATAGSGPMVLVEWSVRCRSAHRVRASTRDHGGCKGARAGRRSACYRMGGTYPSRRRDSRRPSPAWRSALGDPMIDDLGYESQRRSTWNADATSRCGSPRRPVSILLSRDNVIDHSQQPDALLLEAHRLAEPAGRLLFGVNAFSIGHRQVAGSPPSASASDRATCSLSRWIRRVG